MKPKEQYINQCICEFKDQLNLHRNIYHALYHGCLHCMNKTDGRLRFGFYWSSCVACQLDANTGCHIIEYFPGWLYNNDNDNNIYRVGLNKVIIYAQKFLDSSADILHKFQFLIMFHKITKQNFWVLNFKQTTSLNKQQLLQLIDINSIPCNQFWQPFKYKYMPLVIQVYINIRKVRPYKRSKKYKKYKKNIQYLKELIDSYINMKVSLLILQRAVKLHPDTARYIEKFIEI